MSTTERSEKLRALQADWRKALSEGRDADVTRISGQIERTIRLGAVTDSTRLALADINAALGRMGK